MSVKNIKALAKSVEKYLEMSKYEDVKPIIFANLSTSDCPLCAMYFHRDCQGCPVNDEGCHRCKGTPYYDIIDARNKVDAHRDDIHTWDCIEEWRKACLEEAEYLESLKAKQSLS